MTGKSSGFSSSPARVTAKGCLHRGGTGRPGLEELLGTSKAEALREEVELLGAGREFDRTPCATALSPVFFGSALTNFGVEPFLEEFLRMTTPPLNRVSDRGEVDAFSPDFSAFCLQDPGQHEQGPPGPAGLFADLLRQVPARCGVLSRPDQQRRCG